MCVCLLCLQPARPPMVRPWQAAVPPLTASVEEEVVFPADEEEVGVVRIAWRGPDWADQQTITACEILWECVRVVRGSPPLPPPTAPCPGT